MNKMVIIDNELDDWERMIRYSENISESWQTVRVKKVEIEVWDWIGENCNGKIKNWGTYFFFELDLDRTAFALVWG